MTSTTGLTKSINFIWEDYFCPNKGSDCVPACFIMAARYWQSIRPELMLPTESIYWDNYLAKTSAKTVRGTSLQRLLRNVQLSSAKPVEETIGEVDLYEEETEPEEEQPEQIQSELEVIEVSNLILDPRTPRNIPELRSALDDANPAVPQILVFDKTMMTHRIRGGTHAVLLVQIDFDKEKLYVVDPSLVRRKEPDVYDFANFTRDGRSSQT
jgi:hypothetical protein